MKLFKKLVAVLLVALMITSLTVPTFAANARMNHGSTYSTSFSIGSSGLATASVYYEGQLTTFTDITVETYIQKRTLGFIWTKVDNGESNKTWVDSSSALSGVFSHDLQLDSTGTYRAVFEITFSGIGASDDVIEDVIEDTYG